VCSIILVAGCTESPPLEPTSLHAAAKMAPAPAAGLLASGFAGGAGSTVGPGGALYVTEPAAGRIARVDPKTGAVTTYASGLPASLIGIGGVMDIAFIGSTAYALVTLVGADVGGSDVVGIYRVDGPSSFTVIADVGTYAMNNPPPTTFFVPSGVQYAMETYRGGLLVTDGHHNRVLHVRLDGEISDFMVVENTVPTGLALSGSMVYMAEAGPTPHAPEDGRIVSFGPKSSAPNVVASGARLLVDVELGRGQTLYALAQGIWDGVAEGSPALPFTGSLVRAGTDGMLHVVIDGLNQPTSLEIIGTTAYIMTLGGELWQIDNIGQPPFGPAQ
jgi:hypothetical protein